MLSPPRGRRPQPPFPDRRRRDLSGPDPQGGERGQLPAPWQTQGRSLAATPPKSPFRRPLNHASSTEAPAVYLVFSHDAGELGENVHGKGGNTQAGQQPRGVGLRAAAPPHEPTRHSALRPRGAPASGGLESLRDPAPPRACPTRPTRPRLRRPASRPPVTVTPAAARRAPPPARTWQARLGSAPPRAARAGRGRGGPRLRPTVRPPRPRAALRSAAALPRRRGPAAATPRATGAAAVVKICT